MREPAESEVLFGGVVLPQSETHMWLVSEAAGVRFVTGSNFEQPGHTMSIPNEEVVDYIVALVRGGGGRTSPQAMTNVINALVGKDAV